MALASEGESPTLHKLRRSVDKVMRQATVERIKDRLNHMESNELPFKRHLSKDKRVRIMDPKQQGATTTDHPPNPVGSNNSYVEDEYLEDLMSQGDLSKRLSSLGGELQNLRSHHLEDPRSQSAVEFNNKKPGGSKALQREKTFPGNEDRQYPTNLINWAMNVARGNSRGSTASSLGENSNNSAMGFLLRRYATADEIPVKTNHKARAREKIKKKLALPVDRLSRIATLRQNVKFIEGKFKSMLNKQRQKTVTEVREDMRSALSNHQQEYSWPSRFKKRGEALNFLKSRTKMIVIVMRWIKMVMDMNKNSSWEKELKSFVDFSVDNGEGPMYTETQKTEVMEGLQFDKNEYKANKEISLSMDVKTILSLRPEARTPEMLKQVMLGLQTLQSLSEYPLDTQEQLCRVAWFQQVPAQKYIIRQGHRPEAFYFILSGLAVVKKIELDEATGEEQTRTVARLTRGQSFGELGLIFKTPRNATVESGTPMDLLVVGKSDFLKIFMHNVKPGEDPDHIAYLKQQPVLKYWNFDCLKEDPGSCLINYFKRGTLITESGKASEWIYFIKSGSCVALKRLKAVTPRSKHQQRMQQQEQKEDLQLPHIASKLSMRLESTRKQSLHPELYRSMTEYYDTMRMSADQAAQECKKGQHRRSNTSNQSRRSKSSSCGELVIPDIAELPNPTTPGQPYFKRTPPSGDNMTFVSLPPIQPRNATGPGTSNSKFAYMSRTMDRGNMMIPTSNSLHKAFQEKNLNLAESIQTARDEKEDVFVTVEKLNSRDIFGMNTVSFSEEDLNENDIPEVALVSNGAEIVMLSKKIFLKHAEERVKLSVQELTAPYPREAQLQENLQIKADWNVYRNEVLRNVMINNYAMKNCMTALV